MDDSRLPLLSLRIGMLFFAAYAVFTIPSLLARWGAAPEGFALLAGWLALAALAWPIARGQVEGARFWTLLVVAAVLLRALALPIALGRVPMGDPLVYPQIARALIAGRGLIVHDMILGADFRALYPPAYPLFLAALGRSFGLGVPLLWASNVALELAAAALIARIGALLDAPGAGRAGAWLFAIWPPFALAAPFAQKESLEMLLVLALIRPLLRLREHRARWRDGAAFGVLSACLALTQPGLAPLPPLFALALLPVLGWRPMLSLGMRALPFALLVMLPWWVRNGFVFGAFVPLTSTGGLGLWIGNNPHATGNWMPLPPGYNRLPELAMSARAAATAKAWIIGHPADWMRLTLTKLVRTAGVEQFTLVRFSLLVPAVPMRLLAALFPLLQGALIALLAAATALTGRARRTGRGDVLLLLLLACVAQILVFALPFEFGERHRYFLMPFLFLTIGFGLATVRAPRAMRPAPVAIVT